MDVPAAAFGPGSHAVSFLSYFKARVTSASRRSTKSSNGCAPASTSRIPNSFISRTSGRSRARSSGGSAATARTLRCGRGASSPSSASTPSSSSASVRLRQPTGGRPRQHAWVVYRAAAVKWCSSSLRRTNGDEMLRRSMRCSDCVRAALRRRSPVRDVGVRRLPARRAARRRARLIANRLHSVGVPAISLIIPCYNEAEHRGAGLRPSLKLLPTAEANGGGWSALRPRSPKRLRHYRETKSAL